MLWTALIAPNKLMHSWLRRLRPPQPPQLIPSHTLHLKPPRARTSEHILVSVLLHKWSGPNLTLIVAYKLPPQRRRDPSPRIQPCMTAKEHMQKSEQDLRRIRRVRERRMSFLNSTRVVLKPFLGQAVEQHFPQRGEGGEVLMDWSQDLKELHEVLRCPKFEGKALGTSEQFR